MNDSRTLANIGPDRSQPTRGPWAVVRGYLVSANTDQAGDDIDGPSANGGFYVANTSGPDKEANARLIAAAPELLAALVGMEPWVQSMGLDTTELRALIAKAAWPL